ncbi:hypothetical protein SAMN05421770_105226 [Granulicella rosea]|uniref:Uncharacterized protein n=1 Tax=Granulicella rosea TaxID=474952 RepID=A0A239KUY1_9BACT|nr:hypothetical protein SAMN05421770_105226 [Granulicella rosea]
MPIICTELAAERVAPRADVPLEQWDEWLRELEADSSASGFERLMALEAVGARARMEIDLAWAVLAIRAAALLAGYEGGRYRHIAELEEMRLRVRWIEKLGSRSADSVLDREYVADWFVGGLPFCSCVAKKMTVRMDGDEPLTAQELRNLRQIGSRLALVRQLNACGELPQRPELGAWLELDGLPG